MLFEIRCEPIHGRSAGQDVPISRSAWTRGSDGFSSMKSTVSESTTSPAKCQKKTYCSASAENSAKRIKRTQTDRKNTLASAIRYHVTDQSRAAPSARRETTGSRPSEGTQDGCGEVCYVVSDASVSEMEGCRRLLKNQLLTIQPHMNRVSSRKLARQNILR